MKELQAYNYCQQTIALKSKIEQNYLELCARLWKIRSERLFEGQYAEWELFLEELKITPSVASRLVKIYEVFVIQQGFSQEELEKAGGWSVVAELLPVATDKKASKELLELASTYTRQHLREHVLSLKIAPESHVDCKHRDYYDLRICRDCGEKWQTHVS